MPDNESAKTPRKRAVTDEQAFAAYEELKASGALDQPSWDRPGAAADEPDSSELPSRRRRTPRPPLNDDSRPALQRRSDNRKQQAINFDLALLEYMRRAVIYMNHRHPDEPGSESLAALVDQALREKIDSWERKFTGGRALPMLGAKYPVPTPAEAEALTNDPGMRWEDVPADQVPPVAEDETVRVAKPPLESDRHEHGEAGAPLTWSELLGDFLTLARRTASQLAKPWNR